MWLGNKFLDLHASKKIFFRSYHLPSVSFWLLCLFRICWRYSDKTPSVRMWRVVSQTKTSGNPKLKKISMVTRRIYNSVGSGNAPSTMQVFIMETIGYVMQSTTSFKIFGYLLFCQESIKKLWLYLHNTSTII